MAVVKGLELMQDVEDVQSPRKQGKVQGDNSYM